MLATTRTSLLGLTVLLLWPAGNIVLAQSTPPDTLDWHRYYPLEVGNIWEYEEAEDPFDYTRYHIVSDTTVGEHRYSRRNIFYQTIPVFGAPVSTSDAYVRYDPAGGAAAVPSRPAGTSASAPIAAD